MVELPSTKPIGHEDLGDKISLEVSPRYLMVIVGRQTYYFNKATGEFDGTSYQVAD